MYLFDYERMREAHGVQAPEKGAGGADLEEYRTRILEETGTSGPWLSGYNPDAGDLVGKETYLRFDIGNVDASIWAEDPPRTLEVMTGRFDPEDTGRWLAACAECPEPETLEHGGVAFYSWGEDLALDLPKRLQPPAFDPVGRGGRIAVLDSLVLRTIETEGMRNLIDAYLDSRDSLADDPDVALAAGALDGLGVYSALLVGYMEPRSFLSDEEQAQLERTRKALGMEAPDDPDEYAVVGTGIGNDEDGLYTVLVYVYEDEDTATRNVEKLQELLATGRSLVADKPWTEYFPASEVWTEGKALIAKLRTESPLKWLSLVANQENLLWPH